MDSDLCLGQVVEHPGAAKAEKTLKHSFVTRTDALDRAKVEVQPSGELERIQVPRASLQRSRGAGVLIPGPLKLEQRCSDKIANDYEGQEPSPAAASLVDIIRCAIGFDDPYAMAVMVAYLAKEFDIVRVKNRFENDEVEEVSPETIQSEFYAAETLGAGTDSSARKSEKMYRDILINLRPKGSDFICEVQLTLTGIMILKKSEQKIYSLMRMASASELLGTFVFSTPREDEFVQQMPVLAEEGAKKVGDETSIVPVPKSRASSKTTCASSPSFDQSWTSAEDLVLDVKSRNPAVGLAQVLSKDAEDEQEHMENVAEDVHLVSDFDSVGRLQKRSNIFSNLRCVCCEEERHAGSQASARPALQPFV
jgi:hypothetical protein